jgi:hypothetical protein
MWASPVLAWASGCGSSGPSPFDGGAVNLEIRAVAAIPLGPGAPPIADAEACLVGPVTGSCVNTDTQGFASLPVPANGEITVIVAKDGSLSNVAHRVTAEADVTLASRMTSDAQFDFLFSFVAPQVRDLSRGHVGIGLFPPMGGNASGAMVELVPLDGGSAVSPIYFTNMMVPDLMLTSTSSNGLAFFLNVQPGRYEVRSTHLAYCVIESGWPRSETPGGPVRGIELEVRANMITGVSGVQCAFP